MEIELSDDAHDDLPDISDNIYEDFVEYSRSQQVGNEPQFLLSMSHYGTGLFADSEQYTAMKITGGTASGKTNMKMGVVDPLFPQSWLFKAKSMSEKALIDDPRWNKALIAAMDELNKVPSEALEFLKSSYGDDGGYDYTRNAVADDSVDGDVKVIESDPKPIIYLIADENDMAADDEMESRVMDIKVDEMSEVNEMVGDAAFDGKNISPRGSDIEYNFDAPEIKRALQKHIANLGTDHRVIIPRQWHYDEGVLDDGNYDYQWDTWPVIKPIFNFNETPSKRHTNTISSLMRASAVYNSHNRSSVTYDEEEYLVAEPQDLGNLIATRPIIMSMTHNLDSKSRAIIRGISEIGGTSPNNGRWAPLKDVRDYLQDSGAVSTISKQNLRSLLKDMDDNYLIIRHEGEGANGADMWEYLGEHTFGEPNIDEYPEAFEDVTDPITGEHISETIASNKDELRIEVEGMTASETMSTSQTEDDTEGADGTLSAFEEGDDEEGVEYNDLDREVAERLRETLDDKHVEGDEVEDLGTSHMIGASPVETYEGEEGVYVRPERPKKTRDVPDTPLDPNYHVYGHRDLGAGQAVASVENSFKKLRETGVMEMHPDDDGGFYVVVESLDDK